VIYLQAPGGVLKIVVLDTDEVARLKLAVPALAPDTSVMVAWTPDPAWLTERLRSGPGTSADIARSIDESARRPQAAPAGLLVGLDGQRLTVTAEPVAEGSVLAEAAGLIEFLARAIPADRQGDSFKANVARLLGRIDRAEAEAKTRPDYTAAVDELLDTWPLDGYELEAFMSATFIPAVEAARAAAKGGA
jgi:hypothetical protein